MDPVLNITLDQILDVFRKFMEMFKKVMAWLGILVLPEDGDYDYPEA